MQMLTVNNKIKEKKRIPFLDFPTEKASFGRYGIHDYPAMLHYLVVRYILDNFGKNKKILYDPFCGSGVSLCEGLRKEMKVYGTDINPLALLIAQVRCSNYENFKLDNLEKDIKISNPDIPEVKNIDYWFKDYVIEDLGKIRSAIKKYSRNPLFNLLLVAFSQTVRDVSNNKKGEFKRFRLNAENLEKFTPDVIATFFKNLSDFYQRIKLDKLNKTKECYLFKSDIVKKIPFNEKVDMVITSPPYGDSKTTVAYGQFSSFCLDWIKELNPFGDADLRLDNESLGGKKINGDISFSKTLQNTYLQLKTLNSKRAEDLKSFYLDLFKSCKNIMQVLNENSIICFVVGNRTVNKMQIPMDEIVKEIFEYLGLEHKITLIRKIYNKRMPSQNSPTNISGDKVDTMKHEYIVILKAR